MCNQIFSAIAYHFLPSFIIDKKWIPGKKKSVFGAIYLHMSDGNFRIRLIYLTAHSQLIRFCIFRRNHDETFRVTS